MLQFTLLGAVAVVVGGVLGDDPSAHGVALAASAVVAATAVRIADTSDVVPKTLRINVASVLSDPSVGALLAARAFGPHTCGSGDASGDTAELPASTVALATGPVPLALIISITWSLGQVVEGALHDAGTSSDGTHVISDTLLGLVVQGAAFTASVRGSIPHAAGVTPATFS